MVKIGIIVVMGGVIATMVIAMIFFWNYQPNVIQVEAGQGVIVGPVEYMLIYQGIQKGDARTESDSTFMKVDITAKDVDTGESVLTKKSQFSLHDKQGKKTSPTHGVFIEDNDIDDAQTPDKKPTKITAFFPIQDETLDDEFSYVITIRPTKEQRSTDIAVVCMTNCDKQAAN